MHNRVLRIAYIVALLTIICTSVPAAQAAPGDLDSTFGGFGTNGQVVFTAGGYARDMILLPDGKIITAGSISSGIVLRRFLPNGLPDTTFFSAGIGQFDLPQLSVTVSSLAVQADGKIVVAGTTYPRPGDFFVARVDPASGLDASFGGVGFVTTDFDGHDDEARVVLVQPDGKIVVGGQVDDGDYSDFAVARYNADGSPDGSFNAGGTVRIDFGDIAESNAMVLQPDGKLVLVGRFVDQGSLGNDNYFPVARLNENGTLDTSFDGDGKLTTNMGELEEAKAVALQPDGKIVVLGYDYHNNRSHLARYLPDGKLDTSFDGDGKLTILTDELLDLALQPDGRMVALGYHETSEGDRNFALHRLLPNGAHDTSFDFDGIAWLDFGGFDTGGTLALQPDGRILAFGHSDNKNVLVRLWPDGTTFDSGGQQTHGLAFPPTYAPGYRESPTDMLRLPDGKFVVAGRLWVPDYSFSQAFVARFTPEGFPDPTFGRNGSAEVISPGLLKSAEAVAVQPDGKLVVAGFSAFDPDYTHVDVLVARFLPTGAPDPSFGTNGSYLVPFPAGGADFGYDLALAPDGAIVVVGNVWTGTTTAWGVARLTSAGQPDPSFGENGLVINLSGNSASAGSVVVQPDGRIVIGGSYERNFFLQRLLPNGYIDGSFGDNGGYTSSDLGGTEGIADLLQAPNGWFYAAGTRTVSGNNDMAVAQYTPDGRLASCSDLANCDNWPTGTYLVDMGTNDQANALALRDDNQLVVAGCFNSRFGGVQVGTDGDPTLLLFNSDLVGVEECATGVAFSGEDRIVMAGRQSLFPFSSDWNIALTRFETTQERVKSTQRISFAALPDRLTSDAPFTLSASASSGLAVSFSSGSPGVCSASGTTLSLSGQSGICTVTASQEGDASYHPAPSVSRSFTVRDPAKQDQTITFEPLPDKLVGDSVTLNATASSDLTVQFESRTPAVCTLGTLTRLDLLATGICTIVASQEGNAAYNRAPQVTHSFAVRDRAKRDQTISVEPDPLPAQLTRDQVLLFRATASSGLPVAITSSTPATCAVSGPTVTGHTAGTCRVSIVQAGDATWNPVQRELQFRITAPGTPSFQIMLPLVRA